MYTKVILVGRITRDLELKTAQSGTPTLSFSVACNRYSKDAKEVDFFNCIAFNKSAENTAKYCKKGSLVLVEGSLQTRSYDNQQGQKVNVVEVVCQTIQFLESKPIDDVSSTYTSSNQTYNQNKTNDSKQTSSSYQELSKIITSDNEDDPF
jgi:single-strand DNA-binding protein